MEGKMKPFAIVHCVLMAVVFVSLIFVGVNIFNNLIEAFAPTLILRLGVLLFCMLGIVISALYIFKGYRKQAAGYYKAFICVTAVTFLIQAILQFMPRGANGNEAVQFEVSRIAIIATVILAFVGVVILAVAKDLGSKKTWIIYTAVIIAYIVFCILTLVAVRFVITKFFVQIGPLLLLGSIGFMIKGKYDDKKARGKLE